MANKKENYEWKLKRLEEVLADMENNEVTLDEAIKKYEEGMKLYSELYKTLQEAEGKINILTENGEESFEEKI